MQYTKFLAYNFKHGFDILILCHIRFDEQTLDSAVFNFFCSVLRIPAVPDIIYNNVDPVPGKFDSNCPANPS